MIRRSALLASLLAPLLVFGAAAAPSCKPVEGTPLPSGPVNLCGAGVKQCSDYTIGVTDAGTDGGLGCSALVDNGLSPLPQADKKLRCDYGFPAFAFTVIVDVPDGSFYAAGRTFVFNNLDITNKQTTVTNPQCTPPSCIPLANLVTVTGQYTLTRNVAQVLGLSIDPAGMSVPVQARLIPFAPGGNAEALTLGLPLPSLYTTSANLSPTTSGTKQVTWTAAVGVGSYERVYYPEPPFDAFIPPSFSSSFAVNEGVSEVISLGTADEVTKALAKSQLDDETGEFRKTTIARRDGLDGWHVWIEQQSTKRRISTIKTLSGTSDTEILHTFGFRQATAPSLVDDVDLVVSPPDSYLAVPKLVSPIINGSSIGFRNVEFPVLPAPLRFNGVVASGDPGSLVGFPANVAFTSTGLLKTTTSSTITVSDQTLQYSTVVDTDDKGQFTTVLPVGTYDVIVEPAEGTGFAKFKTTVDTSAKVATLRPPKRTIVTGRAILADGRPLSQATLTARAAGGIDLGKTAVIPRAAVARTADDGTFQLEADQGTYDLMTDPQIGTVFPRVVQRLTVSGETQALADIVVPPGGRFALTIRDPSVVGNPIAHALVRVFAEYPGQAGQSVEIASGTTDASGYIEISLAPQTR